MYFRIKLEKSLDMRNPEWFWNVSSEDVDNLSGSGVARTKQGAKWAAKRACRKIEKRYWEEKSGMSSTNFRYRTHAIDAGPM